MEAVVPPEITAELTQILSNLVLGDNDIRQKYVHQSVLRVELTPLQRRTCRQRPPRALARALSARACPVCDSGRHRGRKSRSDLY